MTVTKENKSGGVQGFWHIPVVFLACMHPFCMVDFREFDTFSLSNIVIKNFSEGLSEFVNSSPQSSRTFFNAEASTQTKTS